MSIGFKEWALVCEALENGVQSILLRKGGIDEGSEGFRFRHPEFFFFPTFFHEQTGKTRLGADAVLPPQTPGTIRINLRARVEWTRLVTDWVKVCALEPYHILGNGILRERFDYGEASGLNVAFVRVEKASQPWEFPDSPQYGGCKSWIDLPEPPADLQWLPVLDDGRYAACDQALRAILD